MAEEALKRLEEQLNCSICLDTFTEPKLLQCFHVFCRQCLVPLGVRDQQGQLSLTCPTCRQVTPIPANGVTGFQSAFHINYLLEIKHSFEKLQDPLLTSAGGAVRGTLVDNPSTDPSTDIARCCFEHVEEEYKLFCKTCGELACYKCGLNSGKHHSHDYEELDQAFEKYKEEIMSSVEPMEEQVTTIKKALALIEQRCEEISDQRAATEDNIHVTFRRLREVLTVRETELVDQLHQTTQGKLKGLAAQSDQIETILAQLSSCLDFIRESIKVGNKVDMLKIKTSPLQQVTSELTAPFQAKPNTEPDMVFSALTDLAAMCLSYGQVFALGSPDPSKCHVTGKSLEVAVAGEKSTSILHAVTYEDKPCDREEPITPLIECELVSEITCVRETCSVEGLSHGQYEISYQPTIKGRHQLHIKVEGQHVRGSPFCVSVKSPLLEKLGTPILTITGVECPHGVTINQKGEVVVAERNGDCISVFSPCGEKLRSFGTLGSAPGEFDGPCGVAVDGEGNILVADHNNDRIQKFTSEGQFLAAVGVNGRGLLHLSIVTDIAFSTYNNKVYLLDTGNHCVHVLNPDLTFSSTIEKKDSGIANSNFPCGVACDSTGDVYVMDTDDGCIQVFTAEEKFVGVFGKCGLNQGELAESYYIAVDTSGMVYVSEGGNHRVSVFTSEGQFVTSFGRKGEGLGEFNMPLGVAVDNSGVVYVCDSDNNRVLVF